MKTNIRIEKGKKVVWNKTSWWWFLFINDLPMGYFKTKKQAKQFIHTQKHRL